MALGCVMAVRNPGVAGLVIVTFNGTDSVGVWVKTVLTINLALVAAGARIREFFCDFAYSANLTADITFVGILGSPSLDYAFGAV